MARIASIVTIVKCFYGHVYKFKNSKLVNDIIIILRNCISSIVFGETLLDNKNDIIIQQLITVKQLQNLRFMINKILISLNRLTFFDNVVNKNQRLIDQLPIIPVRSRK